MIEFEVSQAGDAVKREVRATLRTIDRNFRPASERALSQAAAAGKRSMLQKPPIGAPLKTGRLRTSIRSKDEYLPGGAGGGGRYKKTLSVGEGIPYFKWVYGGVREHRRPLKQARAGASGALLNRMKGHRGPLPNNGEGIYFRPGELLYTFNGKPLYLPTTKNPNKPDIYNDRFNFEYVEQGEVKTSYIYPAREGEKRWLNKAEIAMKKSLSRNKGLREYAANLTRDIR